MIIDAHYHLEERMVPLDALLAQVDRSGVGRVALIAALQAPFESGVLAEKAALLVRRFLNSRPHSLGLRLYRTMVTGEGNFSMLGRLYPIYNLPDNENVARAMRVHPDRFYGWIAVNPGAADPCAEVEKWAGQAGWIGVKAHPFWHRYPVTLLDDVADYCGERGLPLLLHLGADEGQDDFRYLPERHPRVKIVFAHAGVPAYGALWEYARAKPNVFVDLSGWTYVGQRERLGAIKALGVRRCLFGTDGPYLHSDFGQMVQAVQELPLPDRDKEYILAGNFLELTGAASG
jgi:predicted TIM-barrel fold metal-dependent hydrolase